MNPQKVIPASKVEQNLLSSTSDIGAPATLLVKIIALAVGHTAVTAQHDWCVINGRTACSERGHVIFKDN